MTPMGYVYQVQQTHVHLGRVGAGIEEQFMKSVQGLWYEMFPSVHVSGQVPTDLFVMHAAEQFRRPEQPTKNAQDVIRAIVAPQLSNGYPKEYLTFEDLYRFMAMFGPKQALMLKIAGLLTCSRDSGEWLQFGEPDAFPPQLVGRFEVNEPNCLVLRWAHGHTVRVWNMPLVDTNDKYLRDEEGMSYTSWEHYFSERPVIPPMKMDGVSYLYTVDK